MKIHVKVKTKAHTEKVEKIDDTHYLIHTKEAPEKGKANEGVIRLLSDLFSLPKTHISIISGKTSRMKVISLHP